MPRELQEVVDPSEECNASIFRVKKSENSAFCFPQFSRFFNSLNIRQLSTLHRVFIVPSKAALSHRKHASFGISRENCCAEGHDIPIILKGAPSVGCRRHGRGQRERERERETDIYAGVNTVCIRTDISPALSNASQENCCFNCDVVTCYFRFAIYLSPPQGISQYSAARWRQNTTYGHKI